MHDIHEAHAWNIYLHASHAFIHAFIAFLCDAYVNGMYVHAIESIRSFSIFKENTM